MTDKIDRFNGEVKAFALEFQGTERTTFGTQDTSNELTAQQTSSYLRGWGIVGANEDPALEDFNAAMFTATQYISYLHQMGVAEWNAAQTYPTEGGVCVYAGQLWKRTAAWVMGDEPDDSTGWASYDYLIAANTEATKLNTSARDGVGGLVTGTATFDNATQAITMTGVGAIELLEIGDVIKTTGSLNNDRVSMVEGITNDNEVIVNYEHRNQTTTKSLVDEVATSDVTITLVCKAISAGKSGQDWCTPPGRALDANHIGVENRTIDVSVSGIGSLAGQYLGLTVNPVGLISASGVQANNQYVNAVGAVSGLNSYSLNLSGGALSGLVWKEFR